METTVAAVAEAFMLWEFRTERLQKVHKNNNEIPQLRH